MTSDQLPSDLSFWLDKAGELKSVADMSWTAERKLDEAFGRLYGSLNKNMFMQSGSEELSVDLDLVYRYLVSLAIQYLAIGILIARDPRRFIREPPGQHIIALVEACAINLSEPQKKFLREVENAFEWAGRYPAKGLQQGRKTSVPSALLSGMGGISAEEKAAMDALYTNLREVAGRLLDRSLTRGAE